MANGGLNGLALRIGAFAVLDVAFRRNPSPAVATPSSSDATRAPLPSPLSAYGSGALLFLIHLLFTDAGTSIAWAHTGFPLGPTAMPHGVLTILALAAGTYLATHPSVSHLPTTSPFLSLAILASIALYSAKGWTAFLAGCLLGTFALGALPAFLDATARIGPSGFFRALTTYNILILASVWTVAYEFVPGGNYLRERTDIVLGSTMALIAAGAFALQSRNTVPSRWDRASRKFATRVRLMLVAIVFASVAVALHRRRTELPTPYHEEARLFTAAIWTMHFGLDGRTVRARVRGSEDMLTWVRFRSGRASVAWPTLSGTRRLTSLVKLLRILNSNQHAHVLLAGLLESDLQRIVMGNRDMCASSSLIVPCLTPESQHPVRIFNTQHVRRHWSLALLAHLGLRAPLQVPDPQPYAPSSSFPGRRVGTRDPCHA